MLIGIFSQTYKPSGYFTDQIEDLQHFLQCYGLPIHQSAPHIYVSAISWLPEQSPCASSFQVHFPNRVTVPSGLHEWMQHLVNSIALGSWVHCVAYAPDAKTFACGTQDGIISIHDSKSGIKIKTFHGHTGSVKCLSFTPDGKFLISGSHDMSIRIWDINLAHSRTMTGEAGKINTLAISQDGNWVATGSDNCKVLIWNFQNGTTVGEPLLGHRQSVSSVVFSPDDQYLISGSDDKTLRK